MTVIGRRFIKSFYKFYISNKDGIVFVATTPPGNVIGLVAGGRPLLRKHFGIKRVPFHALSITHAAITSSYARKRLFQHIYSLTTKIAVKLKLTADSTDTNHPTVDPAGTWSSLLSICTDPDFRAKGVGRSLMEAFRAESMARGYRTMRLSVHSDNHPAIALYKKCGWQVVSETEQGVYFKRSVES